MCGRFNDHLEWEHEWVAVLGEWPTEVDQTYNKAPTQTAAAFTADGGRAMRWGLIPAWSKEPKTKYSTFNAKLEDIDRKPAYRAAWKADRRCLIPCAGYYEWLRRDKTKQPYYIHNPTGQPLFMAGLWEEWSDDRQTLPSCTVITREPVGNIARIHNRMPAMVPPELLHEWLSGDKASALAIGAQDVSELVAACPVSSYVNNSRNDGPACIEPLED
jgi:putative SOS response-associated peptidase YedK